MNQGIYPLAATMINQLNRVDVLSNNLANSNTNGFKQDHLVEGSFNNYLKKAQEQDLVPSKLNTVINTIPKIDGKYINQTMGAIVPTNNQLDFAIKDENVFFKIQNPRTNEVVLTRDGAFDILNNKLVTKDGWNVLNIDNAPIITEEDFASQISVVKTDFSNLQKEGNNNYKVKNPYDLKTMIGNEDYVLQGAIEKSNINSILSMVGLIDSQRRFEQAQKAMTGIDEINQKVIDKIGNNR